MEGSGRPTMVFSEGEQRAALVGLEKRAGSLENKMASYVRTIKADAKQCEPAPCGR